VLLDVIMSANRSGRGSN